MTIRTPVRDNVPNQMNIKLIILLSVALSATAATAADEIESLQGVKLWSMGGGQSQFTAAQGPSLLRPPASWSWSDASAPELDLAAGVGHRFTSGLSLDAGLSFAHSYEQHTAIDYRDYFFGLSYGSLDGRVWYLPETQLSDEPVLYYEAGWKGAVSNRLSLSLRIGQMQPTSGYGLAAGWSDQPSLSLGASTDVGGYGLGLRLIDGGGGMFGGEQDLRLMGSISRSLR